MVEIPIEMLDNSFLYEEYDGVDRNHVPKYKAPKTVQNVRIDHRREYYRDSEDSGVRYEAKIYAYKGQSEPYLDFLEQSQVTFDDKTYTIVKVYENEVQGYGFNLAVYELEVI
jgi:hypothetical protein